MQLNYDITCLCFANERGDLLVGQPNQIIVYKMQDYLPPKYLIEALSKDFHDDMSEQAKDFDPEINFWGYNNQLIPSSHCSDKKYLRFYT